MIADSEQQGCESKMSGEVRCNHRGSSCMKAGLLKKETCIVSHNTLGL